jgi:hypothetical protein
VLIRYDSFETLLGFENSGRREICCTIIQSSSAFEQVKVAHLLLMRIRGARAVSLEHYDNYAILESLDFKIFAKLYYCTASYCYVYTVPIIVIK